MLRARNCLAGALLAVALPVSADVYKCVERGKVTYSHVPCATSLGTVGEVVAQREEERARAKAAEAEIRAKEREQREEQRERARVAAAEAEARCAAAMRGPATVRNSEWDGSVREVMAYLKIALKEPDSFEAIEWSPVKRNCQGYSVRVMYRARNGFGGMTIENQTFQIGRDGMVIEVVNLK